MTTYDVPTSIDGTGAADTTGAILAFIASVPDGNRIVFPPSQTYRSDGILNLTARHDLEIDANGSLFFTDATASRNRSHWQLVNCETIHLTNGKVRGPNVNAGTGDLAYDGNLEGQHGFQLEWTRNTIIDHWEVSKIHGDWIYISGTDAADSDTALIEDCHFIDNGRQGFAFIAARNVEVRYNVTDKIRRSVMDFEPNSPHQTIDNIWVHHNKFGVNRLNFVSSKGYAGHVNNIRIEDNTTESGLSTVVQPPIAGIRKNWALRRNKSTDLGGSPSHAVIGFHRTDGVTVTGNVQPMQIGGTMYCAQTRDCTSVNIYGNICTNGRGQHQAINKKIKKANAFLIG